MANREKARADASQKKSKETARASRSGYLSAKESRAISKANRKITDELAHTMNSAGVSRIADIDESFLVEGQGPAAIASYGVGF